MIRFWKNRETAKENILTREVRQPSPLDSIVVAYIEYLEQFKKHPELVLVTQNTWNVYAKLWPRYRRVITATNFYQGPSFMQKGKYVEGPILRMWFYKAELITVGPALNEPLCSVKDNEIVLTDNYYSNPFTKNTIKNHWGI